MLPRARRKLNEGSVHDLAGSLKGLANLPTLIALMWLHH